MHQLPKEHLDISTQRRGGGGRSANAYLRQETAKFRISQSSTSLLFPSPYKRAWMFLRVLNLTFPSPHSEVLAVLLPLICMHAWIRILCAPSNSGASVFASLDSTQEPRVQ